MKFSKSSLMKGLLLFLVLMLSVSLITGCGGSTTEESNAPEGEGTEDGDKSDVVIKVGSKDFTEQLILGQITILALQDAGFTVEDKTNVAGSDKVRSALVNGEIDIYWEYTGTGWLVHLQHDNAITDPEEAYAKVKEEDAANNIVWLDYAPLDNTYTIMMTKEDSEALGIETISQLGEYVNQNPNKIIFAGDHEYTVRPDGLPALEDCYGYSFGANNIKVMEMGLVYKALKDKQINAGMGFATDGRIAAFDLVNLKDDKQFFPVYNGCPVIRKDVLDANPEIADILNPISAKLDTATMTELNYQVDIEEKRPEVVAKEWLQAEGFIK
ncbi:MAG: glycine betaine ABC transporter substrate-binding protein [Bacillota bacterium]|jgi:osmoprotectant transport system substrate-binding protein